MKKMIFNHLLFLCILTIDKCGKSWYNYYKKFESAALGRFSPTRRLYAIFPWTMSVILNASYFPGIPLDLSIIGAYRMDITPSFYNHTKAVKKFCTNCILTFFIFCGIIYIYKKKIKYY